MHPKFNRDLYISEMYLSNILQVIEAFMMPHSSISQYLPEGRKNLLEKILPFVRQQAPIEFVMLGFPFKSNNTRDKVIGALPDLGEELVLQNFARFNAVMEDCYPPGIKIHIVSDGHIFADLMEVADSTVDEYVEISKDLSTIAPVYWHGLRDFYGNNLSEGRKKVTEHFGITTDELQRRILMDANVNAIYTGMIRFLELDLSIKSFPSKNALTRAAKALAREMMYRNEAYSQLVQSEFKDYIRLSMHPSTNNGVKYSIQLIPGERSTKSPWHCAILKDSQGIATVHKRDAEALGAELVFKDGRPYYYTL